MEIVCSIFLLVLITSLQASIVAFLITTIKKFFDNIISPRIHYALWFLLLIRLLVPFFPESNLSLFNIFQPAILNFQFGFEKDTVPQIATLMDDNSLEGELYESEEGLSENQFLNTYNKEEDLTKQSKYINTIGFKIISLIWLIGFLFMVFLILLSTVKIKIRTKSFKKITDVNIINLMNECRKKLNIKKQVSIYSGNYFKSPCILGIISPDVYYPQNMLASTNDHELSHIFLHELIHYKRKDQFWNLVGILALSIHWFNPFVWICFNKMKIDRELACDTQVLGLIGEEQAISYGMTIIKFLKNFSSTEPQPNLLFFYESNNQLERRIRMIKGFKKRSSKIYIAVIICCIVIAPFIFTNAVTSESNKDLAEKNNPIAKTDELEKSISKDKLVVIDPGHGGHDPGANSPNKKLQEKDIVLDVSLRLKKLLEKDGFKVHMARQDDTYVDLNDRCSIANELKADAFISIHTDAHTDSSIEGVQALYHPNDDRDNKIFASILKNSLVKKLNTHDKGITERTKLICLRDTKMPAISLGIGFLTNPREEDLLAQDNYRQKCSEGIYKGIVQYFNEILIK